MLGKKKIFFLALFLMFSFTFLKVSSVNAWELTDPFFSSSQVFDIYLSYMTQAEGAPYIQNDVFYDNVPRSTYILTATDSAIQEKTLFGYQVSGYTLNGDDKTKTYHSAQAIFYFTIYNSSYVRIRNVPIRARYVITNDSNDFLYQYVDCQLGYQQNLQAPYEIAVSIECPQATLKRVGYHYQWVDLYVGSVSGNDFNSDYFYRYNNGGGIIISANVGQYIVSSTDNASELALEQITEQNQTIINQNQEYYDHEYQAVDNINNQTDSQFGDISSPTTSNLIGILTSFINSIASIRPASDCEITLPFPDFAGGAWVVNPCQNKEKISQVVLALGTIVTIYFVMHSWNWLSIKIYRLIRSFIDGSDDTEGEDNG